MKLLLTSITAELCRYYEYYDSLDRLILPPGTDKIQMHSSSPAKNRNIIITEALKHDYTHIFFTDDDHIYQPDTVMKLIAQNVDIVSGMYCMKFAPFPIIAMGEPLCNKMSHFINMNQYTPNQLIEIPRIPAGCMLVKTDALRKMGEYLESIKKKGKWFTLGQIEADEWGDDLWFCDIARACSIPVHIDTGVQIGHITKVALWPKWDGANWTIEFKINDGVETSGK